MIRTMAWWRARKRLAQIQEHITLTQMHMGLCPFCPVPRISFEYDPGKDWWRCDNCDAQGNLAEFIHRYYNGGKSKGERLKEQGDAYMAQDMQAREQANEQRRQLIDNISRWFKHPKP